MILTQQVENAQHCLPGITLIEFRFLIDDRRHLFQPRREFLTPHIMCHQSLTGRQRRRLGGVPESIR